MLSVFSKGRRKSYDCFTIEVRLKNSTLWGWYPYNQRKGVPPPRVSAQPRAIEFLWQKFSAIFSATTDFFEEISKLPTNKDLAFVTVPFSLMLRDIYADISAKPCTCSEAINKLAVTILKYPGKKASKYKSEGNFSHKKAPDPMWDLGLIGLTMTKILRFPFTR